MADDEEPGDYIEQRQDIHDVFFLVGTQNKERISTLRCFLANYSSYFRAMLLETEMKEKNSKEDIVIPDHEPDVFRLMLRYVYGHHDIKFKDVNQAMRFHTLVDKCLMPKLKKISTKYLVENCTSNLCEILDCAVMLEIKEMEPRAKSIIEKDTKALLSSPGFLNANPVIVEFIVKQEGLNVTEVELWRALVKWAKHQCGNAIEGRVLRRKLNSFIKHIQFLKMTLKEFAEEVVCTEILEPTEINKIFVNMATGKGNKITEAPSKPRQEYLPSQVLRFVATFQTELNTMPYNQNWTCNYIISQIKPRQLRITSLELAETTPQARLNGYPNRLENEWSYIPSGYPVLSLGSPLENGLCEITLYYSQNYRDPLFSITAYRRNNQWQPSPTLEFSDSWTMEASRSYRLNVNYKPESSGHNLRMCGLRHSSLGQRSIIDGSIDGLVVMDACQVSYTSTLTNQQGRRASIIKTIKFSVVES